MLFRKEGVDGAVSEDIYSSVIDRMVGNGNAQDSFSLDSILEAPMFRVGDELPAISRAWIMRDNARNYRNDVIPIFPTFLCAAHGIYFQGIIRARTGHRKVLTDAHLSVEIRHILQYIGESGNGVCATVEQWKTLQHNGGISNYMADLNELYQTGPKLTPWCKAISGRPRCLSKLGWIFQVV